MIPFQTPGQPPATPKFYIDSVTPSTITADGQPYEITISGDGFKGDSTVSISGAGLTVSSVSFRSNKLLVATIVASIGASTTSRNVTVTRGANQTTAIDALTVVAPPTETIDLFSISPGQLQQGDTAQFIISGDAIDSGVVVTISGAGVTANVVSSTHNSITVDITATGGATVGFRDVTATNPALDSDTLFGVLEITAAPVIPPGNDFIIDQAWLDFYDPTGKGPWYLDQAGKSYLLDVDVTVNGTAFAVIAQNITLDLNGHTITHNNAASTNPANNGFENALAGTWDVTGAPAADRFAGDYLNNEVHLGDYSLRFQLPCPDQYVESVGTITLSPNTMYSFSGMLQRGNITTGGTSTPTAVMWCELVGQSGEPTRRFQKTNGNTRGIQFTDVRFTTGPTSETYKVRCGITGASGVDARSIYFDDIRVLQVYNHGIIVGVTSSVLSSLSDGTVTRTGNGSGFTIVGTGAITQGQNAGRECSPILFGAASNCVIEADVQDGIAIFGHGPLTKLFWTQSGSGHLFRFLEFTSNVLTIRSRDQFDATVIGNNGSFEVDSCTFYDFPHSGIRSSPNTASSVHDCTFSARNRFTNGFAINVRGPGTTVYNNVINNYGQYNGRGIMCDQTDPTFPTMFVYDNTINVQSLPLNQEYHGSLIAWAIQCENAENVEIYGNTVHVYGVEGEAACFRLNNNSNNCHIHDNIFIAEQVTPGVHVSCMAINNVDGNTNLIEDNEFRSNKNWFHTTDNTTGIEFYRNTFTILNDTPSADARWWESDSSATNESQKIDGWKFIDPIYTTPAARATVEDGSWRRIGFGQWGRWDNYAVLWTTTAHVVNGGNPVNGATVNFRDTFATVQANGTTDINGDFVAAIPEFKVSGDGIAATNPAVKTEYNDYTAEVTAPYSDSQTFTADQVQTVNVVN